MVFFSKIIISGPGDIVYPANVNTFPSIKKQGPGRTYFKKLNTSNGEIFLDTDDIPFFLGPIIYNDEVIF